MKHDLNTLVQYIKDYANFHYSDGGWDVIVECWGDKDIIQFLTENNATTEKEALASFKGVVTDWGLAGGYIEILRAKSGERFEISKNGEMEIRV